MSQAALALTAAVGLLALLLLALLLRSGWRWQVKAAATAGTAMAVVTLFLVLQASLGLPTSSPLPDRFHLHSAVIDEPPPGSGNSGRILLWISPRTPAASGVATPRAHALPYSRELHEKLVQAIGQMAEGTRIEGRSGPRGSQGFSANAAGLQLFTAPPPMPSAKRGG